MEDVCIPLHQQRCEKDDMYKMLNSSNVEELRQLVQHHLQDRCKRYAPHWDNEPLLTEFRDSILPETQDVILLKFFMLYLVSMEPEVAKTFKSPENNMQSFALYVRQMVDQFKRFPHMGESNIDKLVLDFVTQAHLHYMTSV